MISEETLHWDPIPDAANRAEFLDVVHLEELRVGKLVVAVTVASTWTAASGERERGAWRLSFSGIVGYRSRIIGYRGNPPLTRPSDGRATWELFPSNYLVESSAPDGLTIPEGYRVHHYVIYGAYVYEIVASDCQSAPLPDSWAHPFAARVPTS